MSLIVDNRMEVDPQRPMMSNGTIHPLRKQQQYRQAYQEYNKEEMTPKFVRTAKPRDCRICFKSFLVGGGICLFLGLIAGIGGAILLIIFNVTKAFQNTQTTTAIATGLVNYWPIGNGDMTDHVGSGTPTSSSSTSYVPNRFSSANQAIYINGGSINLPTAAYFYGAFTLMMWVKLTAIPASASGLMDCGNSPSPSDDIVLVLDNTATPNVLLYSGSSSFVSFSGSQSIALNSWTHIALTWDGTNAILYINGVQDSTSTGSGMPQNIARSQCAFGSYFLGGGSPLYSYLDEIRIYNRALSASEISYEYSISLR